MRGKCSARPGATPRGRAAPRFAAVLKRASDSCLTNAKLTEGAAGAIAGAHMGAAPLAGSTAHFLRAGHCGPS
eukprot:4424640-Pyramimonas_sp.AAC.1